MTPGAKPRDKYIVLQLRGPYRDCVEAPKYVNEIYVVNASIICR